MREWLNKLRRRARILLGTEPNFYPELEIGCVSYGDTGANWRVAADSINSKSIVYSIGVGQNISFELALIEAFGNTVHAFDPTPRSLKWMQTQNLPMGFQFYPLGLGKCDGELTFYPPLNPAHVSFSVNKEGHIDQGVVLPVRRLGSILSQLGHSRVDLLKMDIEGSEYEVIEDLVAANYDLSQILVEFHHWMPGFQKRDTEEAVERLRRAGYRLFDVSSSGKEYGFVRQGVLENAC